MFYAFKTVLPKVWESNGLIKKLFVKQGDGYNEAWHNWNGRQERLLPVAIIKWSIWLTFKLFCTNIYKLELGSLNPIRSPWIFLFLPFFPNTENGFAARARISNKFSVRKSQQVAFAFTGNVFLGKDRPWHVIFNSSCWNLL